ncbi:MAG: hypothetical protein COC12_08770 [Rhodobacteraceae bacterium]|nr:MAG: hypothetical protein COC12_08770 [Paracoccaceae bacterium]
MQSAADSAPTSGLVRQSFEDIDQQAQCLTGYDQKYQQLSRGQFNGQFSTLLLGAELGLYFENLNQLLDQAGSIPQDQYSVIFLMNKDQPCKLNGRDFSADDLFFGRPGASFQTLGRPGTHFCVVSFAREYLDPLMGATQGDAHAGFDAHLQDAVKTNPAFARQLRAMVEGTVASFEQAPAIAPGSRRIPAIRAAFVDMIAGFSAADPANPLGRRPTNQNAVRMARDYIHAHAQDDISVADICAHVGVSRRTLEASFQTCLEQSPGMYLRLVRLNEIRRALQSSRNNQRSIGDIAAEWGVWHLSRLAQYYSLQFGELPSQTRENQLVR